QRRAAVSGGIARADEFALGASAFGVILAHAGVVAEGGGEGIDDLIWGGWLGLGVDGESSGDQQGECGNFFHGYLYPFFCNCSYTAVAMRASSPLSIPP